MAEEFFQTKESLPAEEKQAASTLQTPGLEGDLAREDTRLTKILCLIAAFLAFAGGVGFQVCIGLWIADYGTVYLGRSF